MGFKQKHLEEAWKKSKQRCKEREKELKDIVKYVKVGLLLKISDNDRLLIFVWNTSVLLLY